MNLTFLLGAALVALLASLLPALIHKAHWKVLQEFYATRHVFRLLVRQLVYGECGTVTVTYYCRGSGPGILGVANTPPTAAQAATFQVQKALIAFSATTDVQALFTHNWGLDASAPGYYDPVISVYQILDNTYAPSLTFDVTNTNVVKVNKKATDAPCTVLVALMRNPPEDTPGIEG